MAKLKLVVMWETAPGMAERVRPQVPAYDVALATAPDRLVKEIADADAVFGRLPKAPFLAAKRLRWVQSIGVGFETMLYPEMIESDVIITNTAGAFDAAMAEHAFALLLSLTRAMRVYHDLQGTRGWSREAPVVQLAGKTMGVLGLGTIGRAVAVRARAFGMRVIALDAQVKSPPEGVDAVYGPDRMETVFGESDAILVGLPLTERTKGLVNRERLRMMKPTAYVVNIARGPIIAEADLIEALKAGEIAGAGLDVFEQEPLPKESPLWDMPNVVITSHVAGRSQEGVENIETLLVENLRRFAKGEPLMNVIDKRLGYKIQ
jgi:phosphoglycerate dehydrogenase-like enzyme